MSKNQKQVSDDNLKTIKNGIVDKMKLSFLSFIKYFYLGGEKNYEKIYV